MATIVWARSKVRFLTSFGMVQAGTGRWVCWAETVQRKTFQVLFELIEQDQKLK